MTVSQNSDIASDAAYQTLNILAMCLAHGVRGLDSSASLGVKYHTGSQGRKNPIGKSGTTAPRITLTRISHLTTIRAHSVPWEPW